jgi:hypothetical protein
MNQKSRNLEAGMDIQNDQYNGSHNSGNNKRTSLSHLDDDAHENEPIDGRIRQKIWKMRVLIIQMR